MSIFSYTALTASGQSASGVVAADSLRQAWETLRATGVYPTELQEDRAERTRRRLRVTSRELAGLFRQLATLVGAGLPIDEALDATIESTRHAGLAGALTTLRADVAAGDSLADAVDRLPGVFPARAVALIRAGEASGHLDTVLERLAEHLEDASERRQRLRAALTYPAIMLAVTAAVLAFVTLWVLPQMSLVFVQSGTDLPLVPRLLLAGAALARRGWWIGVLGFGVTAPGVWYLTRGLDRRQLVDAVVARVPVLGSLRREEALARVSRAMALLLQGGVPLDEALGLSAQASGDAGVAVAVGRARDAIREGAPLATALGRWQILPTGADRIIAAGERTGRLAKAFAHAATLQEADALRRVDRLMALLEPAMVLAMGLVVLVVVTTVLVPILTVDPIGQ